MSNEKRYTVKKNLTFALLALMAITAHAQHFDWVDSLSSKPMNIVEIGDPQFIMCQSLREMIVFGHYSKRM